MTTPASSPAVGVHRESRFQALIPAALLAVYAFLPGDPSGLLTGPPWQSAGGIVTVAILAGVLLKCAFHLRRSPWWVVPLLLALIAGRGVCSKALVPEGWSSSIVLNQPEGSVRMERVAPRAADGGVIDQRIDLSERSAAFQFLNDGVISPGGPDAARPVDLELRWRGSAWLTEDARLKIQSAGTGSASVTLDGRPVDPVSGTAISLPAGVHDVVIEYLKPPGQYPRIQLSLQTEEGSPVSVFAERPTEQQLSRHGLARAGLRILDLLAALAALVWVWPALLELSGTVRRLPRFILADAERSTILLIAIPLVLFALHGLVAAPTRNDLTVFLIGDDMRLYAANGRNIALHGLLMNAGKPWFTGEPFFFYPLYPYFVALTHRLFDESFYGLVLLQFVLLGIMVAAMAWLARLLFGPRIAWLALGIVAVLAELDFVRYYTVSVFTDNLYYPLVALGVGWMIRMERSTSRRAAVIAGVLGGVATLTRPSMMLVLPLYVAWRWRSRAERAVPGRQAEMLLFVTSWMVIVGVATLRNWLASGRFVLIAESSMQIIYCLTPAGVNFNDYMPNPRPSVLESIGGALRMFRDHPLGVFLVEARKFIFMFGFTNIWPGQRIHPEFLALTASYVTWLIRAGRRGLIDTAAVHITLVGHVLALLASTPAAYGYKTMLTLMMLMVPFAASLVGGVMASILARRNPLPAGTSR